ncbi:sugar transferase [Hyunsoonleella aestuarii]|uniref:Sugar transferase n=1 Tax=Hyunsoonleella aestuarii TaxID=912802 RepID=A0ABP8E928_9FLAO|nr:sugar transferase [Hyunsoonleella aestuarii]
MKKRDIIFKRIFDFCFSLIGLTFLGPFILILIIISFFDTKQKGIFTQKRVGQNGKLFSIYKITTLKEFSNGLKGSTEIGQFLRGTKLDELPQLFNVLKGDMSFVGPRPDVEGYADKLIGDDRIILTLKPGITGLATIHFKNEEQILDAQDNPDNYNKNVIWPKKVQLNKKYLSDYSFFLDLKIILKTVF